MRTAIVHDYLIQMGGAEQVVAALHRMYPAAPVYTSVVDRASLSEDFSQANLIETWLRHIPRISKDFKKYFPAYPLAFRSLGKIDADVAIVSSSGFSKWARFAPGVKSICYCHTPPRFFWMSGDYLEREIKNPALRNLARAILRVLRKMDFNAAQRFTHFVANSECVQQRIKDFYNRDSVVIYPPVRITDFAMQRENQGYYLIVSRLVGYKRIDLAVKAFSKNGRRLIVVGDGPDRQHIQSLAASNVEFKGRVSREEVRSYMMNAYAVVFPGFEDFGITPVEANACGKPVLAFGAGGALESIISGKTGLFFSAQEPDSVNEALLEFEQIDWNAELCAENARRFSEERFAEEMSSFVGRVVNGE